MSTPHSSDYSVVMSDDQYDGSLDEDFQLGSESGESEGSDRDLGNDESAEEDDDSDDGWNINGAFQLRERDESYLNPELHCEHQRAAVISTNYRLETLYVGLDDLDDYKRSTSLRPTRSSSFEDLCRCCDELHIPKETATDAHFLYDYTWNRGVDPTWWGDSPSKSNMSASLFIACNGHNFLISPETICDAFNADGKLFSHALSRLRTDSMHLIRGLEYSIWKAVRRPRRISQWRMDVKRHNLHFSELLDRPESLGKCNFTIPPTLTRKSRSSASFRRKWLLSAADYLTYEDDNITPSYHNQWYMSL